MDNGIFHHTNVGKSIGRRFILHNEYVWLASICQTPYTLRGRILKNGVFTLKTHQMFLDHTTPGKFKNTIITSPFGFGDNSDREIFFFEKFCFYNVFRLHENTQTAFSIFSGLKRLFAKLRFLYYKYGLVWTVSLTVEEKLFFNFFSGVA